MAHLDSAEALEALRQRLVSERDPDTPCIAVCAGTGCLASGAREVIDAFRSVIEERGLNAQVTIRGSGCPGFCERGPVVVIYPEEICYLQVTPEDVPEIVAATIEEKRVVERLLYMDPDTGERAVRESDIPFYKRQERLLLGRNILLDSKRIDDYIALGGYAALAKALGQENVPDACANFSHDIPFYRASHFPSFRMGRIFSMVGRAVAEGSAKNLGTER